MFEKLKKMFRYSCTIVRDLGVKGIALYLAQQSQYLVQKTDKPIVLIIKSALYPLICRRYTSDLNVFKQIFVKREYSCLDDINDNDVDLIIDCGANVGFSSAYFLTRFSKSYMIAIEPDPDNFKMLEQNLAPYKDRVHMIQTGVWSHSTGLVLSESNYRDRQAWSTQVRECEPGELPTMLATDIGTILKKSGRERISILKIDIEGSEAVVFSANYDDWLSQVDVIAIELHDDTSFGNAPDIFFAAISKENFEISRCEELTICRRRT